MPTTRWLCSNKWSWMRNWRMGLCFEWISQLDSVPMQHSAVLLNPRGWTKFAPISNCKQAIGIGQTDFTLQIRRKGLPLCSHAFLTMMVWRFCSWTSFVLWWNSKHMAKYHAGLWTTTKHTSRRYHLAMLSFFIRNYCRLGFMLQNALTRTFFKEATSLLWVF